MNSSPGKRSFIALLAAILFVVGVAGGRVWIDERDAVWPPEYLVNRIAIVTDDGTVSSLRPDGSDQRPISEGAGYFTWPTWSPDGRRVAYSGVVENARGDPVTTLFLRDMTTEKSRAVRESAPGFTGLLADGVVHYPLWSPDGRELAFIAATRERGLTLYLDDVTDSYGPVSILDRGPLWMSWSSDSNSIAVHRAEEHFVVRAGSGNNRQIIPTPFRSQAYRVPAWTPGMDEFNAVKLTSGVMFGLYAVPASSPVSATPLVGVSPNAAFLWAADGSRLAIADEVRPVIYGSAVMFLYRQLRILDSTNFESQVSVSENIVSFFWSPDSSKIAYATLLGSSGAMRWTLLDVESGDRSALVDFLPSPDQLTMFQFFDQYAYSHRVWSPDSRYLVFAGTLSESAVTAGNSVSSRVFIVDTGPMQSVQPIAEGVLGFWSPS